MLWSGKIIEFTYTSIRSFHMILNHLSMKLNDGFAKYYSQMRWNI